MYLSVWLRSVHILLKQFADHMELIVISIIMANCRLATENNNYADGLNIFTAAEVAAAAAA